jgi:hypothetical protein
MEGPELDYLAICLDTSAFHRKGYLLEKGSLKQLEQFKDSPVTFLMCEVMHHEVASHMIELVKNARRSLGNALDEVSDHLRPTGEQYAHSADIILAGGSHKELALARLDSFYEKTGAVKLPTSNVNVPEIMQMYFETTAPFEKTKDKKAEFPDAVALVSLEHWAEKANGKILVVSHDNGWADFCTKSKWLVCIDDLSKALTHFQPHTVANKVIEDLKAAIEDGTQNTILNEIQTAIQGEIDDANVDVEFDSYFYVHDQYGTASFLGHEYQDESGDIDINLLRVSGATVVLQLPVLIKCEVVGHFGLSIRDPIDKDMVPISTRKMTKEYEYQTEVIVTLAGDFSRGLGGLEVETVELTDAPGPVDFGEIEVAFDREDHDETGDF